MRIGVLSLQFNNLPHFSLVNRINSEYCDKHGYEYRTYDADPQVSEDRHPIWAKIKRLREHLSEYDCVLQMDADAIFINHDRRLEDLYDEYMRPSSVMLVGTNRYSETVTWNDSEVNTGVFMLKNVSDAHRMLEYWWENPGPWKRGWPVEQGAFNHIVKPKFYHWISVIHYKKLNGFDGEFVKHFGGHIHAEKMQMIEKEYNRHYGISNVDEEYKNAV
jgi:hypothetical protein